MDNPSPWGLEDSPALVLMLDTGLNCVQLSQAWRKRIGLDLDDESEISLNELFDLNSNPKFQDGLEDALDSSEGLAGARIDLKMAKGLVPASITAWRSIDPDDNRPRVLLIATDINQIADASEELTQLRSQYELILESAGEGVWGLDREGKITFGNRAAKEILGWELDEVMGQRSHDLHHHSHEDGTPYPRNECPIYAALTDGEVHHHCGNPDEKEHGYGRYEEDGTVNDFGDI